MLSTIADHIASLDIPLDEAADLCSKISTILQRDPLDHHRDTPLFVIKALLSIYSEPAPTLRAVILGIASPVHDQPDLDS